MTAERVDLAYLELLANLVRNGGVRTAAVTGLVAQARHAAAELRIARVLLERLIGTEPVDSDGCLYCHEGAWPEPAEPDEYPHVAECPWLQAVNEVALVRAVHTIRDIDGIGRPAAADQPPGVGSNTDSEYGR